MTTTAVRTGLAEANGTHLYHEIRGDGPPVLFISGGGGDAGVYQAVAELLADTYTVVTYDRRGNSRSPKPPGWTSTTVGEQADDCIALIEALGLERPVGFGNSGGGTILVGLLERHARALRGAIVHEPGLFTVTPKAAEFSERMVEIVTEELAAHGDAAKAMERVGQWMFGDAFMDAVPADMRERIDANQDVNVTIDGPSWTSFVPDEAAIAAVEIPIHAAYGEDTTDPITWLVEAAEWVSKASGGPLHVVPGAHAGFVDRPAEFAEAVRPILASMS